MSSALDERLPKPCSSHHPEVVESRFNSRTAGRRTRVHAGRMLEAIGCNPPTQTTIRFYMRDPRCLRDKSTRYTNPILYLAVGRHSQISVSTADCRYEDDELERALPLSLDKPAISRSVTSTGMRFQS
jgi:hypothetical protein